MNSFFSKFMSCIAGILLGPDKIYISEFYYYDRHMNLKLDTDKYMQSEHYSRQMAALKEIKRLTEVLGKEGRSP